MTREEAIKKVGYVYVYEDMDNNDVRIFSTHKKAVDYRKEQWGDYADYDYATIHKRKIES